MDKKPKTKASAVDHPPHYTTGNVECIDAIAAACTGLSGIEAVCVANVIKYVWRFKHKNGREDLHKARWYLDKLLAEQPASALPHTDGLKIV